MILFYSGCGNSRLIAEKLAVELGERLIFIPDAQHADEFSFQLEPGEALGFIWPVYCWAPPQLVLDYISSLKVTGASYIYTVMTYGDTAGLSEKVFRKALEKTGLHLDSAYGVQMPETYVNMGDMALDDMEVAARKVSAALTSIPRIAAMVKGKERLSEVTVGPKPWLRTNIIKPFFYKALVTDRKWVLGDDCAGCGKCADVCPLKNIIMKEGRPQWQGHCTTCEACYHACPKNAIQFGKVTQGKGQYSLEAVLRHIDPKSHIG